MKASACFSLLLGCEYSLGSFCHKYFKLFGFLLSNETVCKGHAVKG